MAKSKLDLTDPSIAAQEMVKAALTHPAADFEAPDWGLFLEGLLDAQNGTFVGQAAMLNGGEIIFDLSFWRQRHKGPYVEGDLTVARRDPASMVAFTVQLDGTMYIATHNPGQRIEPEYQLVTTG